MPLYLYIKHKFHILEDVSNTNKTENERKSPPIYLVIFYRLLQYINVKLKKKKRENTQNTCTFYITNLIYCVDLLIRPSMTPHGQKEKGSQCSPEHWTKKYSNIKKNLYIIYTIILFPEKYWLKYWLFHYKSIFPQSSLFFIYTVIFPHFTNPMHTLLIFSHMLKSDN